jgi:hypothetical protein
MISPASQMRATSVTVMKSLFRGSKARAGASIYNLDVGTSRSRTRSIRPARFTGRKAEAGRRALSYRELEFVSFDTVRVAMISA